MIRFDIPETTGPCHSQHSTDTELNVEGCKILIQIAIKKRWVFCFVLVFATKKSPDAARHGGKDLGFVANPTSATSGLCVLIYKSGSDNTDIIR